MGGWFGLDHQVQERVNSFEITRDWVGNAPPVFFGLVAGALSDQFGRKPLMIWPIAGKVYNLGT